jgi:hypothetical protein
MSVRRRAAWNDDSPRAAARSQKREAPTRTVQMSASMTKTLFGKSPRSWTAASTPNAMNSDVTTAATTDAASRAPAYRHTPR